MEKFNDVLTALRENNMQAFYAPDKAHALQTVKSLLVPGETVACGGSMTLKQCGVHELLSGGDYAYLDRDAPGLTQEQRDMLLRRAFFADSYIMSSNAVLRTGELYNVDGNSNRVAALCFGPRSVIVLAGRNKIADNLQQAVKRVRLIAAPMNAKRLGCDTYCKTNGRCIAQDTPLDACRSDARICCSYVLSARQRIKDRVKVILIDEDLGF